VYWVNEGDGTVRAVPLGGGAPVELAKEATSPHILAIDASCLFWTNGDGSVRKVAKP